MYKLLFFVLLNVAVFGGFAASGGKLITMWQPGELIIIFGAGIGAMLLSAPMNILKELVNQLKALWSKEQEDPEFYQQLFRLCYALFNMVRQKGFKVLDEHIEDPNASSLFSQYPAVLAQPEVIQFLADNMRLQSMVKIAPHDLAHLMEEEVERQEADALRPSETLYKIGEAMPGFGILAAVMGIIITMGHLGGSLAMIGIKVAAALVGTFIGIYVCYAMLHPISSALDHMVHMRMTRLKVLGKMITYFAKGKPPLVCIDAGRRQIQQENRPSFVAMEQWLDSAPEGAMSE